MVFLLESDRNTGDMSCTTELQTCTGLDLDQQDSDLGLDFSGLDYNTG